MARHTFSRPRGRLPEALGECADREPPRAANAAIDVMAATVANVFGRLCNANKGSLFYPNLPEMIRNSDPL